MLALLSLAIAAGALAYKVRNAEDKKKALLQFFGCADEEAPPHVDDEVVGRLSHQLEDMVKTATLNSPGGGGGGGVQADYFRAEVRSDQDIVAYAMDAVVHPPLDSEKITVLLYAPGTYLLRQRAGGTSIAVSCKPKDGGAIVKTELQGTPHGTPEEKQAFFAEARSFANATGAESIILPAGAARTGVTCAATDDAEAVYDSLYAVASATPANLRASANQRNSPPSAPQTQESAFAVAPGREEQLGGESAAQSPAASPDIELAAREARAAAKKTATRKAERDRRRRNKRHSTESSVPATKPFDSNPGGAVVHLPTVITNPSYQTTEVVGAETANYQNATVVGEESISFVKNNALGGMVFRQTSDV